MGFLYFSQVKLKQETIKQNFNKPEISIVKCSFF